MNQQVDHPLFNSTKILRFWPKAAAAISALIVVAWTTNFSDVIGPQNWFAILPVSRWALALTSLSIGAALLLSGIRYISLPMILCLFGCAALLPSVITSQDIYYSAPQYARLASIIIIASAISTRSGAASLSVMWIYFSIIFICLISLFLEISNTNTIASYSALSRDRMVGISNHPNTLGQISGIALIISLFLTFTFRHGPRRHLLVCVILSIISVFCLLESDSRASIAFFALTFAIFIVLKFLLPNSSWNVKFLILVVISTVLAAVQSAPLLMLLTNAAQSDIAITNAYEASNAERISAWDRALSNFQTSPWEGLGFGLPLSIGRYRWDGVEIGLGYAHNLLLNSLHTSGIAGLFFFFCVFMSLVVTLWSVIKLPTNSPEQPLRLMGLSLALFLFFSSSLDGALQGLWFTHLVFFLGLAIAYGTNIRGPN